MSNNISDYVLSATLELKDKMTGRINTAKSGLESMKGSATRTANAIDGIGISSVKAMAETGKLKKALTGIKGSTIATVGIKDNATSKLAGIKQSIASVAGHGTTATVGIKDNATGKLGNIKQRLADFSGKAYSATVTIKTVGAGAVSKAGNALSGMAGGMLMNTSMQMAGAAGIGYGIYDTVKTYMDFEAQMKRVQGIAGVAGSELDMLTNKAKEMGATTQFSATEAGQALEYMAMAGWKTNQMVSGLPGVMNLAAASGEDLGRVSDIVTDALTAFGLKAEDSTHFADVLAQASSNANTNVSLMGTTFKYVAPLAGSMKYSIEDTALAIGLMANAGIKGDQAGTSLRATITRLVNPPKDAATALDQLGITVKNADGTIKPLRQTMKELRSAFSGLTNAEKVSKASSIAGQEAMSGFLAVINASDSDFNKLASSIDASNGAADKMAKTMNDNLKGDMKALASAWESLQLKIMTDSGAASGLRGLAQSAKHFVEVFQSGLNKGLGTAVFDTAVAGIKALKDEFINFDGVGSVLAGGALATGLYKIVKLANKAKSAVQEMAGSLRKAGDTGIKAGGAGKLSTSGVGEMVVNAGSVIVNGKNIAGGGGVNTSRNKGGIIYDANGNILTSGKTAPKQIPERPLTWSRVSGQAGTIGTGTAIAGLFSAIDIYSTVSDNKRVMAEAADNLNSATSALADLTKKGGSSEEFKSALQAVKQAEDYKAATALENQVSVGKSIGSSAGVMFGTVLGGALGSLAGPAGTMIGMTAGGIIGEIAGNKIGGVLANYNPMAGYNADSGFNKDLMNALAGVQKPQANYFDANGNNSYDFSKSASDNLKAQQTADSFGIDTSGNFNYRDYQTDNPAMRAPDVSAMIEPSMSGMDSLSDAPENGIEAWNNYKDSAVSACSEVQNAASTSNDAISSDMAETGTELVSNADMTSDDIASAFDESATDSMASWDPVSGWFNGSVYSPTAAGADNCGSSISSSFADSASNSESAWSGVVSFFDSIWNSLKQGAASAAASIAQSIASAAANARAGGHDIIASGLNSVGSVADWLGGTDYNTGHYAIGTSFAEGGFTEVNEHGGEIIDLPAGSRVYPHATTMRMLKDTFTSSNSAVTSSYSPRITITGNSFTVREEADIDRIAYKLLELIQMARSNINPMVEGSV